MNNQNKMAESMLKQLFKEFVDAGLHGRFEEALNLIDEPYIGVGMGEQGIVQSKEQAEIVLHGGYRLTDGAKIEYEIENLTVSFLSDDVAFLLGKVNIVNIAKNGKSMHSGLMQTIGFRRKRDRWSIAFTHASPTILTMESVEAYPIRFMDHTISLLKAGMQAETVLYAEINLTQNAVVRLECKEQEWSEKLDAHTLEETVLCGLYGALEVSIAQEYHAFFNRLRLLGLFAEGVTKDHFDYCMRAEQGEISLRATVEMVRQAYSGDIMAVISYTSLDNQKLKLEHFTHKAFHDALTGVLNRDGFESQVAELLCEYNPQNNTALFLVDLDDFKQINDRLGHQIGDTVLQQVADMLQHTFRDSSIVGRVGGDEFMVLLTGQFSTELLETKAGKLLNSMKLCLGDSKQIPVSVSIGIAYGRGRVTFEKFYRIADIALYTAKKAGKCRYHLICADTNAEQGYTGSGTNLLSLQSLLAYTDGKEIVQKRTPYEALVENIPGSVLVISLTDRLQLTHCNDWGARFLGYELGELSEIEKENALALVHPDDLFRIEKAVERIRAGEETVTIIYRLLGKDGTYRHVRLNASLTERCSDEITYYGIVTDVGGTDQ